MKKIIIGAMVLFSFLLTGCTQAVSAEKWGNVDIGMSVEQVERELGKPKSETEDNAEVTENVSTLYRKMEESPALVPDPRIKDKMKELEKVREASENGESVKEYIYEVERTDGNTDYQIYFVDGEVYFINYIMN